MASRLKLKEVNTMHVKNTYPSITKGSNNRRRMLSILRWIFIVIAVASITVNIFVGAPIWSVIVILSLHVLWTLVLSPDLVEYNRISQSIKTVVWSSILLAAIDLFLYNGFALFVVPIICFGGLVICMTLFFTDIETQKHNMIPLIFFIIASIIASVVVLCIQHDEQSWPYMVLLGLSVTSLFTMIIVLGQDFLIELKRRFHVK